MNSDYNLKYEIVNLDNLDKAYEIQKNTWPDDPDYDDLYDKAINTRNDNCSFLVYDGNELIGLTGVDVFKEYSDTIWLDWFTILPEYRQKGYGEKVLTDTIEYCKKLKQYDVFRVEMTYWKNRPASFLYSKVMEIQEKYTREDIGEDKTNTLIYSYSLSGKLDLWNNRYLGIREYYNSLSKKDDIIKS